MKKILSILVLIIFMLSMTCYSFATSVDKLNDQKSDITSQKKDAEEKIDQLEQQKDETLSQINELSDKITDSEKELENLSNQIKELEASIKTTEKELKESEEEAIRSLKFSQLMREPVTRQLNVVVNKGEREFTGMLLGKGESDDNRIWDIKI